ncbi:MAG: choice-of-anchor I family protein, partial [Dolichospermum sp.]|nr:choice-of-anchor I family protein [Dolichospermum sp.]
MNSIQLNNAGTIKLSGAEISDFDPKSQRLFVTGASGNQPILQVVDASNPTTPIHVSNIDLSSLGAGIQSVAVRKGTGTENSIVAVAISANTSTNPGKVAFYDAVTLTKLAEVAVGALPDMITFTPDGSKLLVANEGEPNEDYSIDPEGSISIIDVSGNIANLNSNNVKTASFTAFNSQEATLKSQGVRIFGKLKSGENSTVAQDLEPEYITTSPDGKTAFITLQENNAFAVLDIATASITKIVPLGFKDHSLPGNGLDASDRDVNGTSGGGGKINIQNWPIFGMYQPDAISSFEIYGKTYYITANEGDARVRPTANGTFGNEGSLFNEEARVSSLNLDPTAFPNATELKKPENLGRLTVTNKLGDTDGDGDFDKLYTYGTRSFSIWDDQGKLVFDSGDQIEKILKEKTPTFFNANNGSTADFDTRSDNKGPEPESVVVGVIDDVPYGFIGLERAGGGVMVYNLSNPNAPEFIQYIRTEGDISPEGLKFISAENSPNSRPLLAVANEVSDTVSFYEIAVTITGTSGKDSLLASGSGYTLLGLDGNDTLDGVNGRGNNILKGGDGDDHLYAYTNDELYGDAGNDYLFSKDKGNNKLYGGDGNDYILADRNDTVYGDAGDDTIFGGLGGNTITGGSGKDTFWLANAAYPNTPNIITDFKSTEDILRINVDNFKDIAQLTFTTQGADTLVSAGDKQLAILQNGASQASVFSITSASATEGNAINFTITRTINTQSSQSITVSTSINSDDTASQNDFTAKTEILTFAQGQTTKTFTVQTTQDSLFEGDETFNVSLSSPSNGAIISSTNSTAKGTINNDDTAPIFAITSASATEGNAISFTITRTGDAQANQSVNVSTAINSDDTASQNDFTAKTETLTFAQGQTTKTFTVQTTQ